MKLFKKNEYIAREMEKAKEEKEDSLGERLRELADRIDEASGDELKELEGLITLLERIVLNEVQIMSDEEDVAYKMRVRKMIPPRFANYKKQCPLGVHYHGMIDKKVDDLVEWGYCPCLGTCSPTKKAIPCRNHLLFHPLESDLVILEFDHWLERSDIYSEMKRSLYQIKMTEEFLAICPHAIDDPVTYIKKYFLDPPTNETNGAIFKLVSEQIDLNLYRDDLYGSNIVVRCKLCHNACKSSTHHPQMNEGRYLL